MLHQNIAIPAMETGEFTTRDLRSLPARLDDGHMQALRKFAESTVPADQPCPEPAFAKAIAVMAATLARRAADHDTGALQFEAYRKKLGHLPREAMGLLVSRALDRCKFFPTIAECLDLLSDWQAEAQRARAVAKAKIREENQQRLDETRVALKWGRLDQENVDAMPKRWKEILEAESLLRLHADGSYRPRPALFSNPEQEV